MAGTRRAGSLLALALFAASLPRPAAAHGDQPGHQQRVRPRRHYRDGP